jgi:hypothetical protein
MAPQATDDLTFGNSEQFDIRQQLVLTEHERNVLIIMACYVVAVAVLWNLPFFKHILTPFKLVSVSCRERLYR